MVLTAEQESKFRDLCREIKPGEYGRVTVAFTDNPSNVVQITAEKNYRFHNEKAEASLDEPQDRQGKHTKPQNK